MNQRVQLQAHLARQQQLPQLAFAPPDTDPSALRDHDQPLLETLQHAVAKLLEAVDNALSGDRASAEQCISSAGALLQGAQSQGAQSQGAQSQGAQLHRTSSHGEKMQGEPMHHARLQGAPQNAKFQQALPRNAESRGVESREAATSGAGHLHATAAYPASAEARFERTAPAKPAPIRGGLAPWQVRQVTTHIDTQLGCSITTDDLARIARLSPCHFSRAFRESFGDSPHKYVMRRRVERAQGLMLATELSLGQIAVECGLADQAHLCKLFLKIVGESPGVWRRARCSPVAK